MTRIESSILVSKSLEETFSFLDAAENHAKFIPNIVEFNKTSSGAFGQVGATALGRLGYFGLRINVPYEIIEHEQNRKLAMKGRMGPILFKDGYVLSPDENGTQIQFWLELMMTGLARIMSPFAGLIGKVHAMETLANLKKALEKG